MNLNQKKSDPKDQKFQRFVIGVTETENPKYLIATPAVTGASRRYAFVEYETERETYRAYKDAHHTYIDDSEVIVDYNRQQLMPGWIPRRLGGGLGGKKESGQLRFGGRERPFHAPLRPIPHDDLKRLGIPAPPEGRYMSCFQKCLLL